MKLPGQEKATFAAGRAAALAAILFHSAACDVTNPGPVDDAYVTLPTSQQGLVNGSKERMTRLVGDYTYASSLIARELFPGGQTGSYGFDVQHQAGSYDWEESSEYNSMQQARWIAEEALRRFETTGEPVAPGIMFQAYNWAGYANRWGGEVWCEAVFDNGPLEPGSAYFERAEDHFTAAIAIAPTADDKNAALAGRAQVRMWLGDFPGAAADAAQVPTSFVFWAEMDFSSGGNSDQRNHLFWAGANLPYRNVTSRFTFYETYYPETGDPRTPWQVYATTGNLRFCSASLQGYGQVPCTQQLKYVTQDDDIRLSSGKEMRLIEAEVLLIGGSWLEAMNVINTLRTSYVSNTTGLPLVPWTATNLTEAWTILKRERGIELWLEGRRTPDERRWLEQNAPGDLGLPDFESKSATFTQNPRGRQLNEDQDFPRTLCFNVSDDEANRNPNIPDR